MCDADREDLGLVAEAELTRRRFGALTGAGAAASLAMAAQAAPGGVVERDVEVRTPDGAVDAVVFHPAGRSSWPGVLLWPDVGGLRPAKREMGRRLAGDGFVVLVVNPYYRAFRAPELTAIAAGPEQQAKRQAGRATLTEEAVARDAEAYIAWLDALPQTSRAKVGVQGYCMGGALSVRTAAAVPDRVGAVASFHGGNGLVSDATTSPHHLIAGTQARYLFATARNDDATKPEVKTALEAALQQANRPGEVEVYAADHGWCVPDSAKYDRPEAERAWTALLSLYRASLT
ncbi:dienelactone hydrolase family protein [Phenylobacterium sp. LjRoot219]|uniref:dienelactone hydrolase family protein n=1 Tax=Phenylobacterium sp. LjRoot219 TaxID=3342283 RepID=UPI003ECED87B